MAWTTTSIVTEKEKNPKISSGGNGPWGTTSIITEREKDTNPNLYIQRAEHELKNFNYNGAITEINEAISLANGYQKDKVKAQKVKILEQFSKKAVSSINNNNVEEAIKNVNFYINNKKWVENVDEYKQGIENIIVAFLNNRQLAKNKNISFLKVTEIIEKCIKLTNSKGKYNKKFNDFKSIPIIDNLENILRSFDINRISNFNIEISKVINQLYSLNREGSVKDNIGYFLEKILKSNYLNINKFNIEQLLDTTNMLIHISSNPIKYEILLNECIKSLFEKVLKKSKNENEVVNWLNLVKINNKYVVLEYEELLLKAYDKYNKNSKLFDDILNGKISMYQKSYIIFANNAYEFGEPKKAIDIINKGFIRNNEELEIEAEKIKLKAYKDLGNVDESLKIYEILLIKYLNPYKNEDEDILKDYYEYIIKNQRYKYGEALLNNYLKNYSNLDRDKRKLINKYLSKIDIKTLRIDKYILHRYNSSSLKNVEYFIRNNSISFVIAISLIIVAAFFIYSEYMYISGKWKAKVISINLYLEENVLVGQEIPYEMKIKTKPQHVKAENINVVSTNPEVATVQDDKIITKNEGKAEIEVYANDELISTNTINVYKSFIKEFTVDYIGDLKEVGDEIRLDLDVEYVSYDISDYDIDIDIVSSDENILKIRDWNVEAVGVGVADIFIRVNGEEKRLIFDISPKKKSIDSLIFKNKYEIGEEIYIDPEFYPVLTFYKKDIYGDYTNAYDVDRTFEYGYLRIFEKGKAELKISNRDNPYEYKIVKFTVEDSYNDSYSNRYDNSYSNNGINEPSYGDGSYIFEESYKKYLTDNDIKNLSKDTLALMRNEIFARNGYIFKEEPYKSYFESKTWYRGTRDEVLESELNIYELENIKLIQKYENQ